jgi:choline-sulfatase
MKPANILVVVCDQLSAQALRAWRNTFANTPHIDNLIATGTRFDQAYTNCPLCQPSRASFWTSRYPHQNGILSNGRRFPVPQLADNVPTLGSLFQQAGYETVHFGKQHDAGSLRGFRCTPPQEANTQIEHPSLQHNYDTRQDRYARQRAVEFLQRYQNDAPYLAVLDINNPHNICGWIGDHQYDRPLIEHFDPLPPLPDNLYLSEEEFRRRPLPIQYLANAHRRQAQIAPWDEDKIRHYLHAYHYYLTLADQEIGKVLDALKQRPDADDTLIVFFSDHGDSLCGRWMATKHTSFYEETVHVPLVFTGAGIPKKGHSIGGLCSLLDLVPTLCDYADIPVPKSLEGQSLWPDLAQARERSEVHEAVFGQWHTEWGYTIEPGRMVRSERYKYTHYREGDGEELYDLQRDPGETCNRIDDPSYKSIVREHRERLAHYISKTSDPYKTMEYLAAPEYRSHQPSYCGDTGPLACDADSP